MRFELRITAVDYDNPTPCVCGRLVAGRNYGPEEVELLLEDRSVFVQVWPLGKWVSFMSATNVITGGCYCGQVRYQCMELQQPFRGLCYCRTCQMISGGGGNFYMAVDAQTFQFTKGAPRSFNKRDTPWSPTRHFCENCGVHLTARSERAPSAVLVKVGTLDDPSVFTGPQIVTWTSEMQKFHLLPSDVPTYAEIPRPPQSKNA